MRYYAGSHSSPAHHAGKVSPLTPSCLPRIPAAFRCGLLIALSAIAASASLRASPHYVPPRRPPPLCSGYALASCCSPPSLRTQNLKPRPRDIKYAVTLGFTWYGSMQRELAPRWAKTRPRGRTIASLFARKDGVPWSAARRRYRDSAAGQLGGTRSHGRGPRAEDDANFPARKQFEIAQSAKQSRKRLLEPPVFTGEGPPSGILSQRPDLVSGEEEDPERRAMTFDLIIRGATLPDGRKDIDIAARDGRIAAIEPNSQAEAGTSIDARGRLVSPPFVDSHFHMDATLSLGLPRLNESGTLLEGIALWGELKPQLTQEAVVERALRYCDLAVATACWRFAAMSMSATTACSRSRRCSTCARRRTLSRSATRRVPAGRLFPLRRTRRAISSARSTWASTWSAAFRISSARWPTARSP